METAYQISEYLPVKYKNPSDADYFAFLVHSVLKKEIVIKDVIGPRCIIKEDGQKIYEKIHEPLTKAETVTLDFAGVAQFASPFFNFAIGQLLKDIEEKDLRRLLQVENLNETGKLVVERVIENAARYHSDIDYRKIVDDILEQQAKESE